MVMAKDGLTPREKRVYVGFSIGSMILAILFVFVAVSAPGRWRYLAMMLVAVFAGLSRVFAIAVNNDRRVIVQRWINGK